MTFAVRQADFGAALERLGVARKGGDAGLDTLLIEAGEAIPY
jgi:hypothetical protein